jgi:hypothetical protein
MRLRRGWRALPGLQRRGPAADASGLQDRCRQEALAALSWSRHFDEPIALPDGRVLKTLGDAGHYVAALPKAKQHLPEWQLAAEMLLNAAERSGITMIAEVAMRRALHAGKPEPPPLPRRKSAKKYRIVR